MTTAIAVVVDVSVVTAVGLVACWLLRRRPASLRHMILAASLAAGASAPILEATLPHWEFSIGSRAASVTAGPSFSSEPAVSAPSASTEILQDSTRITWTSALVTVWAIGVLVMLGGLITGLFRLNSMTRRCRPVQSSVWRERGDALTEHYALTRAVAVLESADRALLLTWGFFRPRIVVPAGARSWTADRIDVVLAHELAHIRRGDWVVQIAAEILRAAHWFNPLIWAACRRLRDESEQACDDLVLRRGIDAADYASHLLAVARHVLASDRGWAAAAAIASPSTLERRVSAMLNASRNREPLTAVARVLAVMPALAVATLVASVTLTERVVAETVAPALLDDVALTAPSLAVTPPPVPTRTAVALPSPRRETPAARAASAQQKPATLSGVLRDASGAVLPGVMLTVTDAAGKSYSDTTDAVGTFAISNLPPGTYQFRAVLAGFSTVADVVMLASGENAQRRWEMRVGSVQETITVVCGSGAAARRAGAPIVAFESRRPALNLFAQQAPVRVGGQIAAPRMINKTAPICPPGIALPDGGLLVILEATIGIDGVTKDVRSLRPRQGDTTVIRAELVDSAMEAVRLWRYTPTRLNNTPVPVIMIVTVLFRPQ